MNSIDFSIFHSSSFSWQIPGRRVGRKDLCKLSYWKAKTWQSPESPLQEYAWMNSNQLILQNKSQTQPYLWDKPPTLLTTAAPRRPPHFGMKTWQLTLMVFCGLWVLHFSYDQYEKGHHFHTNSLVPNYISECLGLLLFVCQTPQNKIIHELYPQNSVFKYIS